MPLVLLLGGLLILGALSLSFPSPSTFSAPPAVVLSPRFDPGAGPDAGAPDGYRREPRYTAFTVPARQRLFDPCVRTDGRGTDVAGGGDGLVDNLVDLSAYAGHSGNVPGTDFDRTHERRMGIGLPGNYSEPGCDQPR